MVFWISWSGRLGSSSLVIKYYEDEPHFFFVYNSCPTQRFLSVYWKLLIPALYGGTLKKGESTVIQNRQLLPLAGRAAACCCGVSALLPHCDWLGLSCDPMRGMRWGWGERCSQLTNSRHSKQSPAILKIQKKKKLNK